MADKAPEPSTTVISPDGATVKRLPLKEGGDPAKTEALTPQRRKALQAAASRIADSFAEPSIDEVVERAPTASVKVNTSRAAVAPLGPEIQTETGRQPPPKPPSQPSQPMAGLEELPFDETVNVKRGASASQSEPSASGEGRHFEEGATEAFVPQYHGVELARHEAGFGQNPSSQPGEPTSTGFTDPGSDDHLHKPLEGAHPPSAPTALVGVDATAEVEAHPNSDPSAEPMPTPGWLASGRKVDLPRPPGGAPSAFDSTGLQPADLPGSAELDSSDAGEQEDSAEQDPNLPKTAMVDMDKELGGRGKALGCLLAAGLAVGALGAGVWVVGFGPGRPMLDKGLAAVGIGGDTDPAPPEPKPPPDPATPTPGVDPSGSPAPVDGAVTGEPVTVAIGMVEDGSLGIPGVKAAMRSAATSSLGAHPPLVVATDAAPASLTVDLWLTRTSSPKPAEGARRRTRADCKATITERAEEGEPPAEAETITRTSTIDGEGREGTIAAVSSCVDELVVGLVAIAAEISDATTADAGPEQTDEAALEDPTEPEPIATKKLKKKKKKKKKSRKKKRRRARSKRRR